MADDELPFHYVPPPDRNLGRRVDTYFILRALLGKGGMGAAYLAEHEALPHVKCVFKLVLVEMLHHPMIISRYHNEAKALALLRHDNIVKLQGLGVLDDGQLYLRCEYVEGKSLDRYVADHGGRLPLRKAVNFIFQVCWALQHAHDRGVIHRDLKPDNLMIEIDPPGSHNKERVKILDFGIAKVVSSGVDMTGSGVQMGTPTYMAPEQVRNAAGVDGRADVFSLAQILYKLVTGKLPWGSADNSVEIYHRQRTQAPTWPPEDLMPREVAQVVHRALTIHPEVRPNAYEFAIELAARVKNGTALLAEVVPDWARSSVPHATTLPRPVEPTPPAAPSALADDPVGSGAGALPPLSAAAPLSSIAALSPAKPPPPVKDITAHASPRALATAAAPSVGAAPAPHVVLDGSATPPVTPPLPPTFVPAVHELPWHPPAPVLAALPTGLASQQFAAEEPPIEPRAPQLEVASEIELAEGTPDPLAYADAELPAVMVSHTLLSGLTSQGSAPGAPALDHREPPPFVVLPAASTARARSARRKLILIGTAACAIAAVAAFAIVRHGSHVTPVDEYRGAVIATDAAPLRGVAVANPQPGIGQGLPVQTEPPAPHHGVASSPDNQVTDIVKSSVPATASRSATTPPAPAQKPSAVATDDVVISRDPPPLAPSSTRPPSGPAGARGTGEPRPSPPSPSPVDGGASSTRSSPHDTPVTASSAPPGGSPLPAGEQRQAPNPQPAAVKKGELVIEVNSWAVIWLNGKQDEAPYRAQLPAGRYRLRMQHQDKDETTTVLVRANETTTVARDW
jgi:eukaryotic-like serine/threonine-protein kinase